MNSKLPLKNTFRPVVDLWVYPNQQDATLDVKDHKHISTKHLPEHWKRMIGFVEENIPKSGALGLNLMGGAGMFAVSIYTIFMGGFYDQLILKHLPSGTQNSEAMIENAKNLAGPEILRATLVIPILLILAFTGLVYYMRIKNKQNT